MARKPEQKVWDALRDAAVQHGSWLWLQRFENLVGDGVPDVLAVASASRAAGTRLDFVDGFPRPAAIETWVELKAAALPKRSSTRLLGAKGLRTDQIAWHLKHASHGGRSLVVIRDDALNWYAVPGAHAESINDLSAIDLSSLSVAWTLNKLFEVLRAPT